jgi:hypothetical protein
MVDLKVVLCEFSRARAALWLGGVGGVDFLNKLDS